MPQNVTIELEGTEYRVVGSQGETLSERRRRFVETMLFCADKPLSIDHLIADWPVTDTVPTLQALSTILRKLVDADLVAPVGKGVRGDPYTYAMSVRARAMMVSVVELLESCTTHRPDPHEIAARVGLEVVDVQAVLGALAVENRAHVLAVYERASDGPTIDDDTARGSAILPPALENEVRELLGTEPASTTPEDERKVVEALRATPRDALGAVDVAEASGLDTAVAAAALQALDDRGAVQCRETSEGPVYALWF